MEKNYSNDKKIRRNTNIEILRLILMIYICCWHVIVHGFNFKFIGLSDTFNIYGNNLHLLTFLASLFSPSVYCFMFISGWYGIHFSTKKYIQFAVLGISCFICSLTIRYFWTGEVTIREILTHIFPIASGKWWFLSDYIKVYLIAPFIDKGFNHLENCTIKKIIIIMSFIEIGSFVNLVPGYGLSFYGLLYIYILARYIRLNNIKLSLYSALLLYIVSLFIVWTCCNYFAHCSGGRAHYSFIILDYNNPFIIAMAVSVFFIFNNIKPNHNALVNNFLSNVLAVYLITEGIDSVLYNYEAELFNNSLPTGILFILLSVIACSLFGYIISFAFNAIYKKINHYICYSQNKYVHLQQEL